MQAHGIFFPVDSLTHRNRMQYLHCRTQMTVFTQHNTDRQMTLSRKNLALSQILKQNHHQIDQKQHGVF